MSGGVGPVGVILAGGRSRRMGFDKRFATLGNGTLLEHVIARIGPQIETLVLAMGADPEPLALFGLPLAIDTGPENQGPLAGVLAGLRWIGQHAPDAPGIVTVPADTPFLPHDLVERVCRQGPSPAPAQGRGDARDAADASSIQHLPGEGIALAAWGEKVHPTCGFWPRELAVALEQDLLNGTRGAYRWASARPHRIVRFDGGADAPDPFFNINTPEDLAVARAQLQTT
jgi:molybdopterin-guanine dinucleotide biosynthesis protein A